MIPETSRERSSSSSGAGSVTSVANSKNVIQDKPTLSAITETEEKSRSVYSNCDVSDPFDSELHDNLLERLQFPREYHQNGYHLSETDMSTIKLTNSYKLGNCQVLSNALDYNIFVGKLYFSISLICTRISCEPNNSMKYF